MMPGRVVCDEYSAQQRVMSSWANFAKEACDIVWNAPISKSFKKREDVHLPRTTLHVEVVWDCSAAVISTQQCPGCCGEPDEHVETSSANELYPPLIRGSHQLDLNEQSAFVECSGQRIELGDYGDYFNGVFTCRGNIFTHMEQPGIPHSAHRLAISLVANDPHALGQVQTQREVVTSSSFNNRMVLYQPRGFSLPNNEDFEMLLRALSARLARYGLVKTVIECSKFHKVRGYESWTGAEDGAPKGDNESADSGISIPLCFIAVPRPWGQHRTRREQFKRISV